MRISASISTSLDSNLGALVSARIVFKDIPPPQNHLPFFIFHHSKSNSLPAQASDISLLLQSIRPSSPRIFFQALFLQRANTFVMSSNMENTISAYALSEALSKLALSDNMYQISENPSTSSNDTADFNDRSADVRDARLANAILCLDEDIPEGIDKSVKELIQKHASNINASALGPMSFLVSEHYLDFKAAQAAKKATEKKLPRSKGGHARKPATRPLSDNQNNPNNKHRRQYKKWRANTSTLSMLTLPITRQIRKQTIEYQQCAKSIVRAKVTMGKFRLFHYLP